MQDDRTIFLSSVRRNFKTSFSPLLEVLPPCEEGCTSCREALYGESPGISVTVTNDCSKQFAARQSDAFRKRIEAFEKVFKKRYHYHCLDQAGLYMVSLFHTDSCNNRDRLLYTMHFSDQGHVMTRLYEKDNKTHGPWEWTWPRCIDAFPPWDAWHTGSSRLPLTLQETPVPPHVAPPNLVEFCNDGTGKCHDRRVCV